MVQVKEIAFTCYPVTDMARSRAFYEGTLGLKPTMVHTAEGGDWTEYDLGAGTFSLGRWDGWPPVAGGVCAALEVEDFDAAIAALRAANVTFQMEPFPTPVCQMAFILDPDGSAVCIHQRKVVS